MEGQYNRRSPAVKRLMREAQELSQPTEQYYAQPLDDNLFEWHFTIRGPADSEFDGGIYHGRIILPPDYPMKPPSIILLTPNGRFEIFKKICLSISGHHPESWQPSWSIRTALLAIIGFMPTHGNGAIGSLDYTPEERKVLAKKTAEWKCTDCGSIKNILKPVTEASDATKKEAQELAAQINFQGEKEKSTNSESAATPTSTPSASSVTALPTPTPPNTPVTASAQPPFPTPPFMMPPHMLPQSTTAGPVRFPFPFPPNTSGSMPPFVPPMFPGMPPVTSGSGQQQGSMPWPPQFQAMMQAHMQAQMRMGGFPQGNAQNIGASPTTSTSVSKQENKTRSSSSSATSPATSSVGSSVASRQGSTATSSQPKTSTSAPATAPVPSPSSVQSQTSTPTPATTPQTTTTPSSPATTPATTATTPPPADASQSQQTSVRRRGVVTTPRTPQSAELPAANRAGNQSMGPATLTLVIMICLAFLLLVLRRLHIMNVLDLSFIF